jgi:hypothetical protein
MPHPVDISLSDSSSLKPDIKGFFYESILKPDAQSYERTLNRDGNKSISDEDKM